MRFQEASGIFINSSAKDTQNLREPKNLFSSSIFAFISLLLLRVGKRKTTSSEEQQSDGIAANENEKKECWRGLSKESCVRRADLLIAPLTVSGGGAGTTQETHFNLQTTSFVEEEMVKQ